MRVRRYTVSFLALVILAGSGIAYISVHPSTSVTRSSQPAHSLQADSGTTTSLIVRESTASEPVTSVATGGNGASGGTTAALSPQQTADTASSAAAAGLPTLPPSSTAPAAGEPAPSPTVVAPPANPCRLVDTAGSQACASCPRCTTGHICPLSAGGSGANVMCVPMCGNTPAATDAMCE